MSNPYSDNPELAQSSAYNGKFGRDVIVGDILETLDDSGNGKLWILLSPTTEAAEKQHANWHATDEYEAAGADDPYWFQISSRTGSFEYPKYANRDFGTMGAPEDGMNGYQNDRNSNFGNAGECNWTRYPTGDSDIAFACNVTQRRIEVAFSSGGTNKGVQLYLVIYLLMVFFLKLLLFKELFSTRFKFINRTGFICKRII